MDVLIEMIVNALLGMATRDSKKKKAPAIPFDEAQRQRALAAQMQQAFGVQGRGPVRPVAVQSRAGRRPQRGTPKPPALPARAVPTSSPSAPVPARAGQTPRAATARVPLRVPLIMGEILGPPLALREPEF